MNLIGNNGYALNSDWVWTESASGGRIFSSKIFPATVVSMGYDPVGGLTAHWEGIIRLWASDLTVTVVRIDFTELITESVDTDNDGVIDFWDKCQNTPEDTYVNRDGCPIDLDAICNPPEDIIICHFNKGGKQMTKTIPIKDLQKHLDHGDYEGACN